MDTKEQPISDAAQIWGEEEYRFHGQRPDEHVMLVKNQHPFVLVKAIVWSVVSLITPYFVVRWTAGMFEAVTLIIYFAVLLFALFYRVYGYRNSLCILTDQRILNVQQNGFFNTQISEAELTRIQDVSTVIKGVYPTMFGFGDVTIRTASKDSLLILDKIPTPYEVQQTIVRALKDVQK